MYALLSRKDLAPNCDRDDCTLRVTKKDTPRGVFFVCECFYRGYLATVNFVVMTSLVVGITMV